MIINTYNIHSYIAPRPAFQFNKPNNPLKPYIDDSHLFFQTGCGDKRSPHLCRVANTGIHSKIRKKKNKKNKKQKSPTEEKDEEKDQGMNFNAFPFQRNNPNQFDRNYGNNYHNINVQRNNGNNNNSNASNNNTFSIMSSYSNHNQNNTNISNNTSLSSSNINETTRRRSARLRKKQQHPMNSDSEITDWNKQTQNQRIEEWLVCICIVFVLYLYCICIVFVLYLHCVT